MTYLYSGNARYVSGEKQNLQNKREVLRNIVSQIRADQGRSLGRNTWWANILLGSLILFVLVTVNPNPFDIFQMFENARDLQETSVAILIMVSSTYFVTSAFILISRGMGVSALDILAAYVKYIDLVNNGTVIQGIVRHSVTYQQKRLETGIAYEFVTPANETLLKHYRATGKVVVIPDTIVHILYLDCKQDVAVIL